MFLQYSPNMLKTFELCPRKFHLKYVKKISMPVNDDIFEFGKNIHALASYYLRGENIDKMEESLSEKDLIVWNYLKSIEYFSYDVVGTEYNLAVKIGNSFFGGRLDALLKRGAEYFILDYKTGSAPKNAKYDYQTIIYSLAVSKFFKTDKIHFIYIDLKNKNEVKITYNEELEQDYINRLNDIVKKINSEDMPEKKAECRCEYSPVCY